MFSVKDINDGSVSHDIFVERQTLQESFSTDNPSFLIDKNIQVKAPAPGEDEASRVAITVSQSNQISVLD